jgi:hypothetical protein
MMVCRSCGSRNEAEIVAEMMIHFPFSGLKNLDKPGIPAFPTLAVCLACGFTEFTITEDALRPLTEGVRYSAEA